MRRAFGIPSVTLRRALPLIAAAGLILRASLLAVPSPAPVTPERLLADFASTHFYSSPLEWLPDSKSVLFSSERWRLAACAGPAGEKAAAVVPAKERSVEWVAIADTQAGRCSRVLQGAGPRLSPGGREFIFRHGEEGKTELWIAGIHGENARKLGGISIAQFGEYWFQYEWSPDGKRVAYSFAPSRPEPPAPAPGVKKASSVRVIGGAGDIPPDSEIWIVDVGSGKAQKIGHAPNDLSDLAWRRDGRALIMAAVGRFDNRSDNVKGEVRSLSVPEGKFTVLVKDSGVQMLRPVPSPDGKRIAFGLDPANITFPDFYNVATVGVDGGPQTQLTKGLFVNSAAAWSPDSKRIFFTVKRGAFTQIFAVDGPNAWKQITKDAANSSRPSASPDGKLLAWTSQDLLGGMTLRVSATDGSGARSAIDLAPDVHGLALSSAKEVTWKSKDGLEIAGYLIRPLHEPAAGGRKPPLFVDVHGGPVGGTSLSGSVLLTTPLEWQMWAAKGYIVLAPDYRSSAVYGWDQITGARDRQDANEKDFDDIMSGIDSVVATQGADPNRIVLLGHSYGSYLTNWLVTHSHRFKVAVSYEGYSDDAMAYGTGFRVGGNSILEWFHKGKPWEAPQNYRKESSIDFVRGVTTPTMFIHGENGIPKFQSECLYSAWKKQGVDTAMLVYGGEGHVVVRPENQRDLLGRVMDWFNKYNPTP